jgi:uncharacterized repeat protein (TIGR01451 family)
VTGSGNTISQVIATLPANGRLRYVVSGTAPSTATLLVNTASVSPPAGIADPTPNNNTSTATTTVSANPPVIANLAVSKIGPTTVSPNGTVTYRIVAINNGPDAANGATIVDTLPSALSSATWTCVGSAGATCAVGTGSGNINTNLTTMPSGGFVTIEVTAAAPASGTFQNSVTITPPSGVQDPNVTDNVGGPVITQVTVAQDLRADVVTTVTLSNPSPAIGEPITATVTVGNIGDAAASNVITSLQLPLGVTIVSISGGGVYDPNTGRVTWPSIASIAPRTNPNSTFTVVFEAPQYGGPLVSTAITGTPEVTLTNNPAVVQLNTQVIGVPGAPWWLTALTIFAVVFRQRRRFAL